MDIDNFKYFTPAEQLVKVLKSKNRSKEDLFFRVMVAYYFSKVASIMRCEVVTPDRGNLPTNVYALSLASSGFGKGMSMNLIEDKILAGFKTTFLEDTMPIVSALNIDKLASHRATKFSVDIDITKEQLTRELKGTGSYLFSFDGGTGPAVKQLRHQLLLSGIGSMNLEMDEVGANISQNIELLNTFIELYDVGKIKPKITKSTAENKRNEDLDGRTPANMLLFGTPSKLLDGSKTEDDFYSMLEMGYARRMLFSYVPKVNKDTSLTPEEIFDMMTDTSTDLTISTLHDRLENLAKPMYYGKQIHVDRTVAIEIITYANQCEERAAKLKDHQDLERAELTHRYFRATKLAGVYAFIDGSAVVTQSHLEAAIKLVEDSGKAFSQILKREKPYVKLAKYIADVNAEVTQVDLIEDLPFYKGSETQKRDLLSLAIAYGYKHNIIIKKSYVDGIEFLKGESLKETDLNHMNIAYSEDLAYNYINDSGSFDALQDIVVIPGMNFTSHHWKDGHRTSANVINGFNMIVLDVDSGLSVDTARELLKDYKYIIYTTKRHTEDKHRFRIILPMSHVLELSVSDYSAFMTNVFEWLPFDVDEATKDISRKWSCHPGEVFTNEGILLDVMDFIPQTKKSDEMHKARQDISSMSNMEAWFYRTSSEKGRNNSLLRYAYVLIDNGYDLDATRNAIFAFNKKLDKPLPEEEMYSSILVTATKRFLARG